MDVLEPRFRWVLPDHVEVPADASAAATRHGLSDRVAGLLVARGVPDGAAIDAFFGEPLDGLHDAALLPDIDILLGRLALARDQGERVLVFGDFDADGLTGLAIMVLALERYGLAVEPYVPSRLDEGHGLSIAALDRAQAVGATVIITVDCGATSHAEIAEAGRRGLDVIVTDHHRVPPVMPAALAVVDPHRPDSRYPDRRLAGSGVAFKIAGALLADLPGGPAAALALADLATIGTVADVAPIVGENRAIARLGLAILRAAPRPGIAAILERANVAPAAVDLETVSFAIAPRLNAAGRVGEAVEAARLLLATTPEDANRHADALEAANLERRDLLKAALVEARAAVDVTATPAATLIHGPWPVGHRRPPRRAAGRGPRPARGRRLGPGRRRSARRAAATARWTSARPSSGAATSSPDTAATRAPPASSSRRATGTPSASGSSCSPRPPRPPTRASRCGSTWSCPRSRSTTRSCASSRAWRRTARATRIRSWPCSA